MPAPSRLVHIPALDLTARIRRDLTPDDVARALAELRQDIDDVTTHRSPAPSRERRDKPDRT